MFVVAKLAGIEIRARSLKSGLGSDACPHRTNLLREEKMVGHSRFVTFVFALFIVLASSAFAAGFPEKDLQGYIPWGAGGATDNVSRALTPHVEEALGKKIVLVNKTGGTGAIATQFVHTQPSDGYTLLYAAENAQLYPVIGLSDLTYSKDFFPVNIVARGTVLILANNNTPWNSFKEMVEDAQKRPGKIKMGSAGKGSVPFVVGALLKAVTSFDVITIPFDGDGPGLTALQGGHVDVWPASYTAASELIRSGRVKVLAIVADEPVPGLEQYPLITKDFPGFKKFLPWGPFYGVHCNKDVPAAAKKILVDAFQKGVEAPKFQEFLANFGTVSMNISGDEAYAFLNHWQSVTAWLLQDAGAANVSPATLGIPKP
jgi:tripartite-type tricarboxylate transporter receptor subunit TctC